MDQRIMSGTYGQVWVDGELWMELDGFQAKYSYNKGGRGPVRESRHGDQDQQREGHRLPLREEDLYPQPSAGGSDPGGPRRAGHHCAQLADPDAFGAGGWRCTT